MAKKIVVFGSLAPSLVNFRYQMLESLVRKGYEVIACAPDADKDLISKLQDIKVNYQHCTPSDKFGFMGSQNKRVSGSIC